MGRYDGTVNSLLDHSHRPKTSPRAHTEQELRQIRRRLKKYKWLDYNIKGYTDISNMKNDRRKIVLNDSNILA